LAYLQSIVNNHTHSSRSVGICSMGEPICANCVRYVIVMENLFWSSPGSGRELTQIYDLKGSLRNRYSEVIDSSSLRPEGGYHGTLFAATWRESKPPVQVLQDQNFRELGWTAPVLCWELSKSVLVNMRGHLL
jgi:hypothetical protein